MEGLRSWNWRTIIEGIIKEHIKYLQMNDQYDDINEWQVRVLWLTFLKVAKIENLDEVPVYTDPYHPHVKACMFMYSMESFLYKRINKLSRDKDT